VGQGGPRIGVLLGVVEVVRPVEPVPGVLQGTEGRDDAMTEEIEQLRANARFANAAADAAAEAVGAMADKLSTVLEEREQMRAERDGWKAVRPSLDIRPSTERRKRWSGRISGLQISR
jgi:uncharacterized coiled-coil DUF342 family protein